MKNLKANPFLRLLKPYKGKVLIVFTAIVLANLAGLVFPWVIKVVVDQVIINKDLALLNISVALLVLSFICRSFFGFLREYLSSMIGENVMRDLRNSLYWHLHKLSVKYVEDTPSGKIISGLIGDVEAIKEFLFGGALDFVYSSLSLVFIAAVLFLLDWELALISVLYLPIFSIAFLKISPRLKDKHARIREKYGELTSRISEVLNGIRVVAGFAGEKKEAEIFDRKQGQIYEESINSHRMAISLWMAAEFLSSLGLAVLIWLGSREVISGRISLGTLMAFYTYLGLLFQPVIRMAIINNYYQEASASMERMEAVLLTEPAIKESTRPVIPLKLEGNVVFSHVNFSYDGKKQVLHDINFQVNRFEAVALVGKSGSGKTTLINLLLRFYDPGQGQILIDGNDLRDLSLSDYRSKVAMVIQDDYLFGATIRQNIAYGRREASWDEIAKAAKLANAHQFINELPGGYDTQIGERGIKLSYGQRQRISIARAILRDPAILILDEATSSVDSETERSIIEDAFKKLMRGRTTFVISHRLSAITYADRIIFMENGRISESGSHSQLLEKKGGYWKMWQSQVQEPLEVPTGNEG
jgi:ABC-type multidrug transport system fused ATPase/permease subunit